MKTYIAILIGIVVLFGIIVGGYKIASDNGNDDVVAQEEVKMTQFNGNVVRIFEGENKINYSLNIPESASTSVDMDGALIRITNLDAPYATIYVSYEGGRGFDPLEYIDEIIAPHVPVLNVSGKETLGAYEWQLAESEGSEWHIAKVMDGEWLIVVENKKGVHDLVQKTLESVTTE